METFYITFGQQSALRNFYAEIATTTKEKAEAIANSEFKYISNVYYSIEINDTDKSFFPGGCLCRIEENPKTGRITAIKNLNQGA